MVSQQKYSMLSFNKIQLLLTYLCGPTNNEQKIVKYLFLMFEQGSQTLEYCIVIGGWIFHAC